LTLPQWTRDDFMELRGATNNVIYDRDRGVVIKSRYQKLGKTVHLYVDITFGASPDFSDPNVGTPPPQTFVCTLPYATSDFWMENTSLGSWHGMIGASRYDGLVVVRTSGTRDVQFTCNQSNNITQTLVGETTPAAWANGHIRFATTYETGEA
jgi:hypothetical protein